LDVKNFLKKIIQSKIMPKIVLYQPEIAKNVGAIIRTCVCFDSDIHIIEPCGFPFDINRLRKSALDYINHAKIFRHQSFDDFFSTEVLAKNQRLILASTKATQDYRKFIFKEDDLIIFGRESSGVPTQVSVAAYQGIFIPMKNSMRSLNLAVSCSIILAQAQAI
jgi:tRNA (cytidine/uridine-2'-O-)-methyltransferase